MFMNKIINKMFKTMTKKQIIKLKESLISEPFAKLVLRKGEQLGFLEGYTENNGVIRGTLNYIVICCFTNFIMPYYADGSWNIGNQKSLSWKTYSYNWHYD